MSRPDGRIEPGQPLRSAISARAWNRAQDAADLVLGQQGGITANTASPYARTLRAPVLLSGGTTFSFAVVDISAARYPGINGAAVSPPFTQSPHTPGSGLAEYLVGSQHGQASNQYPANIFAICESIADANTAPLCVVRGVTYARVRVRESWHRFAVPSIPRQNELWSAANEGTLDSTDCECDGAARILGYGEGASLFPNQIYWAMILL